MSLFKNKKKIGIGFSPFGSSGTLFWLYAVPIFLGNVLISV
jgi:hypothetical protein